MEKIIQFPRAEFDTRLAAVKNEMSRRSIDVLLVSEPANLNYLTGYDAFSFYTPQMMVVALNGAEPIFVMRGMDVVSARITTYLAEDSIRSFPDNYVNSSTLSPYDYVADVVKEVGGENATIGAEMGGFYFTINAYHDMLKALPQARFVDADLLINWIRLVKSAAEVELMRQAGRIGDAVLKRAKDTAAVGVRECDLVAAIYHQAIAGTPEYGGNYIASAVHFGVGGRALAAHSAWTDAPLAAGAIFNVEMFANRRRYQINVARTFVLGKPPAEFQRLADVAVEGLNAALDAVRPGRTCSEVFAACAKSLARHGIEKKERIGYPIGIGYPPAVGERTASIRPEDTTVLQSGMCFHLMSGLWLDDRSVTITQPFVVRENGCEPLTHTSRELVVKEG